jgi:hypothetical protein
MIVAGTGGSGTIPTRTYITAQTSGVAGGAGTYSLSASASYSGSSAVITASAACPNFGGTDNAGNYLNLCPGIAIENVASDVQISGLSSSGNQGYMLEGVNPLTGPVKLSNNYSIGDGMGTWSNGNWCYATEATISGTTLTINGAMQSPAGTVTGTCAAGQTLVDTKGNVLAGTAITAQTGGTTSSGASCSLGSMGCLAGVAGTYTLNQSQTVSTAETMTTFANPCGEDGLQIAEQGQCPLQYQSELPNASFTILYASKMTNPYPNGFITVPVWRNHSGTESIATDSAANIVAAIANPVTHQSAYIGQSWTLLLQNESNNPVMLSGGTNVTPAGNLIVNSGANRNVVCTVTAVATAAVSCVGQ